MTGSTSDMESLAQIIRRVGEYNAKTAPPVKARRLVINPWMVAAALVLTVDAVLWREAFQTGFYLPWGIDFETYRGAAQSWFAGTGFYLPYQFQPYQIFQSWPQPVMYPPTAAPVFLLLTLIPAVWWFGPPLILAYAYRRQPWPKIALALALLLWPGTTYGIVTGNPGSWLTAAVSMGLGSAILLKPALFPFLLVGVRTRRWWALAGVLALISLAMLPMWFDWITILLNGQGSPGITWGLAQVPLLLIGVLPRVPARRRPA